MKCIIPSVDVSLASCSRPATTSRFDHTIDSLQLPFYLVGNPFYCERDNPYGYQDDYERFVFFGRAILAMLCHPDFAQEAWQPDVIHGHDWITGLIPTRQRARSQRSVQEMSRPTIWQSSP